MNKICIVVNHSYNGFYNQAKQIQNEIIQKNILCDIITNMQIQLSDINLSEYSKCIFLDKDIPVGISMELHGIRLYNNIGSIEACDDKRRTYEILKNDFNLPKTFCFPLTFNDCDLELFKNKLMSNLKFPFIAKEAYGSLGKQVSLIKTKNDLDTYMKSHLFTPHLYQEFITTSIGKDMRIYVVGGKAIAGMIRENKNGDFRSNIAIGSESKNLILTPELCELCENISNSLGLDFCGIDLLYGQNNVPIVCEVNSNAMFIELQKVSGINISDKIATYVCENNLFDYNINNLI